MIILAASCEKELEPYHSTDTWLNFRFYDTSNEEVLSNPNIYMTQYNYSFAMQSSLAGKEIDKDTVWFEVGTMGFLSDANRTVELQQVQIDTVTNAVPGVHYIPFDDPSLLAKSYVPAGQNTARIPVVLLRDASLAKKDVVLKITFKENSFFKAGYQDMAYRTLYVSDRLNKPANWDLYYMDYTFGTYGQKKHELMIAWTGKAWDDAYLKELSNGDRAYMDFLDQWFQEKLAKENEKRQEQGLDVYREADAKGNPDKGEPVSFKPLSWQ